MDKQDEQSIKLNGSSNNENILNIRKRKEDLENLKSELINTSETKQEDATQFAKKKK